LLSGGEHVGKKTVNSDADLPPIAQGKGKKAKARPRPPEDATPRVARARRFSRRPTGSSPVLPQIKAPGGARMGRPLPRRTGARGGGAGAILTRRGFAGLFVTTALTSGELAPSAAGREAKIKVDE